MADFVPRWFDEGYASYAAREWGREDVLATNLALALRGVPTFDELDEEFGAGATTARNAYALAYRAVVELAALDTTAGLSRFFNAWRTTGSMDRAMRSEYGITFIGFESRWRANTRRRYGALALAGDATILGAIILLLVIPLYVARKQRDRRRLAELIAADEASERAARDAVIEALLRGDEPPLSWDDPEMRDSS